MKIFFAVIFSILSLTSVKANNFDLKDLAQGQSVLYLNAKESKKVQQDLLVASLTFQEEGTDKKLIQNNLNIAMKSALNIAKDEKDILHYTEGYQVYMIHQSSHEKKIKAPTKWRAQQNISLEGKNKDALLELARKLQGLGLHMNQLNYRLSTEKYDEVSDSLMEGVLNKLQLRAEKAAKTLGKSKSELVVVNINKNNNPRPYYNRSSSKMYAMAEADTMEAPSVAPGQTEVVMNVTATALLSGTE